MFFVLWGSGSVGPGFDISGPEKQGRFLRSGLSQRLFFLVQPPAFFGGLSHLLSFAQPATVLFGSATGLFWRTQPATVFFGLNLQLLSEPDGEGDEELAAGVEEGAQHEG